MFFQASLLANTEETKPNTTIANIYPEHKLYYKGLLKSTLHISFYKTGCRGGIACREMAVEFSHCKANLMPPSEYKIEQFSGSDTIGS